MQEAMESASPLHLAEKMPDAYYIIYHCEQDEAVNKQMHSDRFVQALSKKYPVQYVAVPERGHCDLPDHLRQQYLDYAVQAIKQ